MLPFSGCGDGLPEISSEEKGIELLIDNWNNAKGDPKKAIEYFAKGSVPPADQLKKYGQYTFTMTSRPAASGSSVTLPIGLTTIKAKHQNIKTLDWTLEKEGDVWRLKSRSTTMIGTSVQPAPVTDIGFRAQPVRSVSGGWVVSPAFDLLFIANIGWPLLLLPGMAGRSETVVDFWQIYFLTLPHRWITLILVAARPRPSWRQWAAPWSHGCGYLSARNGHLV